MNELIKNTEEKMNKTIAVLERDYKIQKNKIQRNGFGFKRWSQAKLETKVKNKEAVKKLNCPRLCGQHKKDPWQENIKF